MRPDNLYKNSDDELRRIYANLASRTRAALHTSSKHTHTIFFIYTQQTPHLWTNFFFRIKTGTLFFFINFLMPPTKCTHSIAPSPHTLPYIELARLRILKRHICVYATQARRILFFLHLRPPITRMLPHQHI